MGPDCKRRKICRNRFGTRPNITIRYGRAKIGDCNQMLDFSCSFLDIKLCPETGHIANNPLISNIKYLMREKERGSGTVITGL